MLSLLLKETTRPWGQRLCFTALSLLATLSWAGAPEKTQLKLGFIKLTDMAPLAIALEKGYFQEEGLEVNLVVQDNWSMLLEAVIDGRLDGAQMLAPQPLGATIGIDHDAHIITALSLDLNGNAITLDKEIWAQLKPNLPTLPDGKPRHPISAKALRPVIEQYAQEARMLQFGMVHPFSTHNYELRYWLAAGGVHPGFYAPNKGDHSGQIDAEIKLSVTPPPRMPLALATKKLEGYCVGEPWNQQSVYYKLGVPVITDHEIWNFNPEKVLGVTAAWAKKHPETHIRLIKALIRAGMWLDANDHNNREEASQLLSQKKYVGAKAAVIAASMHDTFEYEQGDVRPVPEFNLFFDHFATYPYYSDAIWYLTQMRRWGQISTPKPDSWYFDIARKVYRPDIYRQAVQALVAEGKARRGDFPAENETGFRSVSAARFIDGVPYDGHQPNAYLESLTIGLKGGLRP